MTTTPRDISSWLPNLIGPLELQQNGVTLSTRRAILNLINATIADNPALERTDITFGAGGVSLAVPLEVGGSGTLNDVVSVDGSSTPVSGLVFTGAPTLRGVGNGTPGRVLVLQAKGGTLTIENEAASSAASNRFVTGTGGTITVTDELAAIAVWCDTDDRWHVVGSGGRPGGTSTEMQVRVDATTFGSLESWTREGRGRLNARTKVLTGGEYLTFEASDNSATRSGGSWILDGFVLEDIVSFRVEVATSPGVYVPGLNNGKKGRIVAITPTKITLADVVIDDEDTDSGHVMAFSGAYLAIGPTDGEYPGEGFLRYPALGSFPGSDDETVICSRTDDGRDLRNLTLGNRRMMFGASYGDLFTGIDALTGEATDPDNRLERFGVCALQEESWSRMRSWAPHGSNGEDFERATAGQTYTDATTTPVQIPNVTSGSLSGDGLAIQAIYLGDSAKFVFFDGEIRYRKRSAGAATWVGAAGGTLAGENAKSIQVTGVAGPVAPPKECLIEAVDGGRVIIHDSGNRTAIPDFNGTLPTSGGASPTGTGFVTVTAGVQDAAALVFPLAAAKGGTGLSALGAGVATFLGTPSSANLASCVTGETGTGALVFADSPTFITPKIEDASGGQTYNLSVSNLAANRIIVLPLLTGTDTFVFEAHAQTLTNKTITGAVIDNVRLSGTVASTGIVRTPFGARVHLAARDTGDTDDTHLVTTDGSNNLHLGTDTSYTAAKQASSVIIHGSSTVSMGVGANTYLHLTGSSVQCFQPVGGSSIGTTPFKFKSASITPTAGDNTLSAAQASAQTLWLAAGAGSAVVLIGPNVADARYEVINDTATTVAMKKSGGTASSTIPAGGRGVFIHNGTDYKRTTWSTT